MPSYHEKEAEIVSQAGKHGAVTIATNMAGRGTDIKLDEEARAAGGLKLSVRNATNPDELITSCAVVQDVRVIRVNQDFTFHLKMT